MPARRAGVPGGLHTLRAAGRVQVGADPWSLGSTSSGHHVTYTDVGLSVPLGKVLTLSCRSRLDSGGLQSILILQSDPLTGIP